MLNTFFINREVLEQIEYEARRGWPDEICGFLGGQDYGQAQAIRPARNVARARRVEYNISPVETLAGLLNFEGLGMKLSGVYHSHPGYPPRPSGTDLDLADLPAAAYLITAVAKTTNGQLVCETRAWRIENRRATKIPLIIKD